MPLDVCELARDLTNAQRQCILDLSEEWAPVVGRSQVYADMLWALGGSSLAPHLPELIDQKLVREPGKCERYVYRLTETGNVLKVHLLEYA